MAWKKFPEDLRQGSTRSLGEIVEDIHKIAFDNDSIAPRTSSDVVKAYRRGIPFIRIAQRMGLRNRSHPADDSSS